jgi:hypothetical protein
VLGAVQVAESLLQLGMQFTNAGRPVDRDLLANGHVQAHVQKRVVARISGAGIERQCPRGILQHRLKFGPITLTIIASSGLNSAPVKCLRQASR